MRHKADAQDRQRRRPNDEKGEAFPPRFVLHFAKTLSCQGRLDSCPGIAIQVTPFRKSHLLASLPKRCREREPFDLDARWNERRQSICRT